MKSLYITDNANIDDLLITCIRVGHFDIAYKTLERCKATFRDHDYYKSLLDYEVSKQGE